MPLRAIHAERRIEIYRDDDSSPLVTQRADADKRPYIHPILAPDGVGELTEDSPSHHPWQHGLYVGLNDVNGVGFWTEKRTGDAGLDGTFHPRPLEGPTSEESAVSWRVVTDWRTPMGDPLLTEVQAWTLQDGSDLFALDMRWTLTAEVDITFGKYPYGGLFLRMPFRSDTGGMVLTSEGLGLAWAEGQRARWVAVSMPIPGRGGGSAGIAILDHISNPEHPVPWRVDHQLGISPSRCIAGPWDLLRDTSTTSRYRVLAFCGEPDASVIDRNWMAFVS